MNNAQGPDLQALKSRLVHELRPGERLVWSGIPDAGQTLRSTSPILLFGLPWLIFVALWEAIALTLVVHVFTGNSSNTPWPLAIVAALFGIPFVAIGVFMVLKPFQAAKRARHTIHAITDQRVITLFSSDVEREINCQLVHTITGVKLVEKGALGSLEIQFGTTKDSDGDTTKIIENWIGVSDPRVVMSALLSVAPKPD